MIAKIKKNLKTNDMDFLSNLFFFIINKNTYYMKKYLYLCISKIYIIDAY